MTTKPNPTAEQLRELVANLIPLDLIHDRERPGQPQDAFEAADRIIAALRAHGLLPEGAPTEAQVEVAAKAMIAQNPDYSDANITESEMDWYLHDARAALAAAGLASQEPSGKMFSVSECPNADHLDMESCGLCDYHPDLSIDREKLIAEAGARMRGEIHIPGRVFLSGVVRALSASQPLDVDEIASVIDKHFSSYTRNPHTHEAWHGCTCGEKYGGHSDLRNRWLSEHRARAVVEYLRGER